MSIASTIKGLFAAQHIRTRAELRDFLESRAAFLVQKSIMEYTQARSNLLFSTLIGEKGFQEAFESARWHSYPAAFSMVAEMAAGHLREVGGVAAEPLHAALQAIAKEVFNRFAGPSGLGEAFWSEAYKSLDRDLARAALAMPRQVRLMAQERAKEVFDKLPVSAAIKRHDFEMFHNTLRFHLIEIRSEFEDKANVKALLETLPSGAGQAPDAPL
jgi:hypothetical protein